MNTNTAIAVAIAVAVIAVFFIVPGLSPFRGAAPATNPPTLTQTQTQPTQPQQQATTTMPTVDQLQVTDETVGTGPAAKAGDTVTVNYVGSLTNGTVFDASANHGQPFSFKLGVGQVIPGWDQGIVGMKVGGKRRLVIPAALAYGNTGVSTVIPPGATLVFEVELVKLAP